MTNKGHLRSHHRANPWLITVLLVCNKNLLWMNHDVGIGVVTTVASAALPPCSRLDRRSCWLNNSLLRPPHSGRHRCRLLGRGYPDVEWVHSHIPPSIIIASIHSTDDAKNEESKRWTCFAWCDRVECSRNVELIQMSGTRYKGINSFCMCFLITADHTERYVGTRKNSLNLSTGLLTRW